MAIVKDPIRGTMQSLFMSDVEMGKKDDDHNRPKSSGLHTPIWTSATRVQPRKFMKRLLVCLFVCIIVWFFVHNIPTDVAIRDRRRPVYLHPGDPSYQNNPPPGQRAQAPPFSSRFGGGSAPREEDDSEEVEPEQVVLPAMTYNGRVRFLNLAPSLRAITTTRGGFLINKNVLFAAASIKSMGTLLPIACQMGSEERSYVHFVLMGRSDITVEELQRINGIDESCNIIFHDARPDHGDISTEDRMESSVTLAMPHIELYMHPQAIIIDGTGNEETYLMDAMRTYDTTSQSALIEMPRDGAKRIGWLAKLDSASLSHWNKISVDILIHAYSGASGSLIRLLKSLSHADFGAGSVPHVTIELPQMIDAPLEEFLEGFQWPPAHLAGTSNVRQLSLRHRIPRHGISEEDTSIRFLESFWPTHPQNSHVLVLSPQAELSPDFFHYVKYSLLEYRYSATSALQSWDQRLLGISLEMPTTSLDGAKFSPPAAPPPDKAKGTAAEEEAVGGGPTPFLSQAPNSNAVLYLGERWMELHAFVTQLLEVKHLAAGPEKQQEEAGGSDILSLKLISKKYPSWLEHALQLSQARGYWTLYPSETVASALSTIHNELYRPPEEYEKEFDEGQVADADAEGAEVPLGSKTLREALPQSGSLPPLYGLPLLLWNGKPVTLADSNTQVIAYATKFRREVGGCSPADMDKMTSEKLFCEQEEQT